MILPVLLDVLTPHRHHDTQLQHQSDQIQVVRYDVRFVASVVLVDGLDKDFRQMRWPRNTDIRLVLDIRMDAVEIMKLTKRVVKAWSSSALRW